MCDALKRTPLHVASSEGQVSKNMDIICLFTLSGPVGPVVHNNSFLALCSLRLCNIS